MSPDHIEKLERRTKRELSYLSFNEKLRYGSLALFGLPLLALVNVVFVLRIVDLFGDNSTLDFLGLLAFAAVIGIAAIGADIWLLRWVIDEFKVFRWTGDQKHGDRNT